MKCSIQLQCFAGFRLLLFAMTFCSRSRGIFVLALSLTGCAYPNQSRNVSAEQAHATLTVKSTRAPFRGHLHISAINEQPTSFWSCSGTYRIPVGPTIVHATYSGWDAYSYAPLQFTAIAGRRYIFRRHLTEGRDYVALSEMEATSEHERVVAQADRR